MKNLNKKNIGEDEMKIAGVLTIERFKNGKKIGEEKYHNLVMNGSTGYGKNVILRKLSNDNTYSPYISTMSLGDSTTAATEADTTLGHSLVAGLAITTWQISGASLVMTIFASDANLANGTYKEAGFFTSDSRIFSHIVFTSNYVKATGEDTLFTYTLNI
jgi:hypothetical protein